MSSIIEETTWERESVPRQRMSYALCSLFRSHSPASFECNVSMGHMLHLLYLSAFCSVLSWKSVQLFQKPNETLSHVCKAFVLVVVVIINNNQFPVCAPQEMFPIVPHLGEKSAMKTDSTKMEIFVMKLKLRGRQAPFPERTCCAASPLLLALPPLSICFFCSVLFAVFPQKNICAHLAVAHLHFIFTTHTVWQQLQGRQREREREWEWVWGRAQHSQSQATLNCWLPCSRTRGAEAAAAEVRLNVGPINVPPQRLLLLLTHASFHTSLPLSLPLSLWSSSSWGILFGLWVGQIIIIIIIPRAVCSCRLAISTSCLPPVPPLLVCYIKTSVATLRGSNSSSRSGADKHIVISEGSSASSKRAALSSSRSSRSSSERSAGGGDVCSCTICHCSMVNWAWAQRIGLPSEGWALEILSHISKSLKEVGQLCALI